MKLIKITVLIIFLCWLASGFTIAFIKPIRFAVIGDTHVGLEDSIYKQVINELKNEDIDFIINLGDITQSGLKTQYNEYIDATNSLDIPVYNVIGNHDIEGNGKTLYEDYFGASYRSFNYEGLHIIFLDNVSQSGLGNAQKEWLEQDLAENDKPVIVCMHIPVYDPTKKFPNRCFMDDDSRYLTKLAEVYNVKYILAGHVHGYAKGEKNGVVYIISGGAGGKLTMQRHRQNNFGCSHIVYDGVTFHHYILMEYNGQTLTDNYIKI